MSLDEPYVSLDELHVRSLPPASRRAFPLPGRAAPVPRRLDPAPSGGTRRPPVDPSARPVSAFRGSPASRGGSPPFVLPDWGSVPDISTSSDHHTPGPRRHLMPCLTGARPRGNIPEDAIASEPHASPANEPPTAIGSDPLPADAHPPADQPLPAHVHLARRRTAPDVVPVAGLDRGSSANVTFRIRTSVPPPSSATFRFPRPPRPRRVRRRGCRSASDPRPFVALAAPPAPVRHAHDRAAPRRPDPLCPTHPPGLCAANVRGRSATHSRDATTPRHGNTPTNDSRAAPDGAALE